MHWKEAARKFTDFQATKMLILRQLRVPLFYLIQSLASVNALHIVLAIFFFLYKLYSAAFTLLAITGSIQNVRVFYININYMLLAMIVANSYNIMKNRKKKKIKLKLIIYCNFL